MITCPCKDCITLSICMATTKDEFFNHTTFMLFKKCSLFRKYWFITNYNDLITKTRETKKIFRFKNDS